MLRESLNGATVHKVDTHISIYFWIVDGIKAVFSIPAISDRAAEYGFSTSDAKLILRL
jgi:hypothetical protein